VRRRPKLPVPLIAPWLPSLWIGLVTTVDARVARRLVKGPSTPTVVTDRSGLDSFEIKPIPLMDALREALGEDSEIHPHPGADRLGAIAPRGIPADLITVRSQGG
jgi:hypothetical protein